MILVGYHSTGGYKVFDASNKRVAIIQDVIVNEIKEQQQPVTHYVKAVTDYNFENSYSTYTGSA